MLTGALPQGLWRIMGVLPSPPRCKLCNAPFRGPGGVVMRALGRGPSPLNRRLCRFCIRAVHKHPGDAKVEISVLLTDVRGSTAIAERMLLQEFSRLMARFYGGGSSTNGTASSTSSSATAPSRSLSRLRGERSCGRRDCSRTGLARADRQRGPEPRIPVGAAVHTGISFVGSVGEGDAWDFTALGDTVNTAGRLTGPGRVRS
jgi:adenylate cyclase